MSLHNSEIIKELHVIMKMCYEMKTDLAVLSTAFEAHKHVSDLRFNTILENIKSVKPISWKFRFISICKAISRFWYAYVIFGIFWFTSEKKGVEQSAYDAVKKTTEILD